MKFLRKCDTQQKHFDTKSFNTQKYTCFTLIVGDALCRQLLLLGNIKSAMILCQGILSRNSSCEWASRRLGFLFLKQNNYADAITSLQTALRCNPKDSYSWEGLATAYESQGRLLAALKSFLKAIQLNSRSFYALIKTANLYVLLGQPANAAEYYRQILKFNPYYPPALIGCSKALIYSAIDAIQNGSLSTAWMILDDSIDLAAKCTNLKNAAHPFVSAWKVLGDSFLLKRYGYGLETEFKNSDAINAISEHTNSRLKSIRDARCAYSKALHLYPNSGSAWYDVACTYYHDKELRKVCSTMSNSEIDSEKLASKTERFLVGALNIHPESAKIWASLGVGARSFSTKEYALSRALQLDPRRVVAWVSLARLYIECKEKELAKQCLDHARSQNPKNPAIWESMALSDLIFDGSESFEFFKHAFSLGCGPDGLSGFTYGALSSFAEREGTIFAAARRLVNLHPVDPISWNILGLISEAREDYEGAIAAYCLALQLLSEQEERNLASNICEQKRKVFGIKQNLTRAYIGSGNFYKAIEVLDALDTSELRIYDIIYSQTLLGVANAFMGHQCEAVACLEKALSLSENDVHSLIETLQCYIQIKCSKIIDEKVFGVFEKHIRTLLEADLPSNRLAELWLTANAAAATLSVDRCIKISLQAQSWARKSGYLDPQFFSSLESLLHDSYKVCVCSSDTSFDPCSHLRKALYLCPWNPVLRCRLAYDLEAASKTYSDQVLSLSVSVNFGSEFRGKPSLLFAALEPALTALLSKTKDIDSSDSMKIFRQCTSSVHLYPLNKTFWCMAALLASKLASENPTVSNLQSAYVWGQRALEVISSDKSLKEMRTRVLICLSECTIHLKSYQGLEEAVQFARLALEVDDSPVSKHLALRQMGRCWWALKDFTSAEKCYQEAISLNHEELEEENMITAIEFMQLLYFLERDTELENVVLNIELRFGHNKVLLKKPSFVGLIQKLFMVQVLSFIRINKYKDAKKIGQKMEDFSGYYQGSKGLGLIAQGIATIHEAVSMANQDEEINPTLVSEARRLLTMGIKYGRDSVGAHVLLALVEYYSNFRKRSERIKMHISNALKRSKTPTPSVMLLVASRLTRDRAYCARAVHTAPWLREAWSDLKVM